MRGLRGGSQYNRGGGRRRVLAAAAVATLAMSAALFDVPAAPPTIVPVGAATPAGIDWVACPQESGDQCGTLQVPLDYGDPEKGTIGLTVIRHQVPDSKGVVVFNPGGPGESGVLIFPILANLVPATMRAQFTLVSFDERGTGSSDPLLCGTAVASAASAVAATASGVKAFAGLESSCRAKYPKLFTTVNTTNSARDMDKLRQALGVSRIDYYGMSYGTVLGAEYAHLFPTHYRSMILDGAVDTNLGIAREALEEAPSLEAAVVHTLKQCTAKPGCPLGTNPVDAFRKLEGQLTNAPLPIGSGNPPVTVGDLDSASLLYLSAPDLTSGYYAALASALAGNGAPLRTLALELENDLNGNSLVGALWGITCNDVSAHPDANATTALARSLQTRYPLLGAEAVSNNLIGCPRWSGSDAVSHIAPTAGPVPLIIGNTGDPNTPYVEAGQLAAAIGGRLVTYVGYGHTWLLNGSSNACMDSIVNAYLLQARLPAAATRCSS